MMMNREKIHIYIYMPVKSFSHKLINHKSLLCSSSLSTLLV